jgi:hypothetical protein
VDALGLIFRAELCRRWRSWLALAVLIAVVGGVVMASAAAGRRTASAFPSFVRTHGYDFNVFNGSPLPQLARYPAVASITTAPVAYNGQPVCACTHPIDNNNFNVVYVPPKEMSRTVNLVAGRMPNPSSPGELVAQSWNAQWAGNSCDSTQKRALALLGVLYHIRRINEAETETAGWAAPCGAVRVRSGARWASRRSPGR